MSCSSVEFAEEKRESVCHFIPKISSSVAWRQVFDAINMTRFAQPYVHMYSVYPFVSFTHYLFLLEEDCSQEDTALMSSSLFACRLFSQLNHLLQFKSDIQQVLCLQQCFIGPFLAVARWQRS
jgi:hypothetical protein